MTEDSFVSVQIFDQKRFKKKGQGFLGLFNFRVGAMMEFQKGLGWPPFLYSCYVKTTCADTIRRRVDNTGS